jgi:hypothetical protein
MNKRIKLTALAVCIAISVVSQEIKIELGQAGAR